MSIEHRFLELSATFPVQMASYLESKKRTLCGLRMSRSHQKFECLFGELSEVDLAIFNTRFSDKSRAGYCESASKHFSGLSREFDVLLLRDDCAALEEVEIDGLLLHELCHWYLDSGLQDEKPLTISSDAQRLGAALYEKTDECNESVTRHTLDFCIFLCEVALQTQSSALMLGTTEEIIHAMMKWDTFP